MVSVHNLGERLDSFIEAMEPLRDRVWVIDDASTDDTPMRLRQDGWRCIAESRNRKKPKAVSRLIEALPADIETVMVIDPDIIIRDSQTFGCSDLEAVIIDFQHSGKAALCPRIAIKEGGLLARLQCVEYAMSFVLGRNSLADESVTSGVAIYRRDALIAIYERRTMRIPLLEALKQQGAVQRTIEALPLEDKTILKLRYGVLQDDELTLRDIGEILGLSRERVRQIESRAEAKCRRSVRRR